MTLKRLVLLLCLQASFTGWCQAEDLFAVPCVSAGIPSDLVRAIARQESDLDPLAVNVAGKSYRPADRQEAEKIIRMAQAQGKSFDVGIMQINSQWHKKWQIDPVTLLDPERNIRLGICILREKIRRYGLNWLAVGKYYSPNLERGRQYAWRVFRFLPGGHLEKTHANRKSQIKHTDILHDSRRIWRNRGIQPKGRHITFRVREAGLPGEPDPKQGRSSSPSRASESKR